MTLNVPKDTKESIDFHVTKQNEKLAAHVAKILFQIYVDAKKLTCSAYSWAARFVGAEFGHLFDCKNANAKLSDSLNLQYVNPKSYAKLLGAIVQSDKSNFMQKLEKSIAASIRVDGSIDRTQLDKIYIMLKILTSTGDKELVFVGIAEQKLRGASGLFEAVKRGMIENVGEDIYIAIMKKITSICTDGTNVNSGDKRGLWTLFEEELRRIGSVTPFTKIWCSSHRMELVWNDVCRAHSIIKTVLNTLSSISSYFHKSAIRKNELKKIAEEKNLSVLSFPKLFTIRWFFAALRIAILI